MQRWYWNIGDTMWITPDSDTVLVGYRKWYRPVTPAPINPSAYPYDTTNYKTSGGIGSLWVRKEDFSGNIWTWPTCAFGTDPQCNVNGFCSGTCWHAEYRTFRYTTTMLLSKYCLRRGYFEIKFKLPPYVTAPNKYSAGPNFWLWGDGAGAANDTVNYNEIDIFEINGRTNMYTCNAHYRRWPKTQFSDLTSYYYTHPTTIDTSWHIASALWTGNEVAYFLDGVNITSINKTGFRIDSLQEMSIVIDINAPVWHLGEVFDPVYSQDYQYKIDYVKVWQMQEDCSTPISYCSNFNPATYVSKKYQSVSIGGSGCTDAIANTSNLGIYATDYILLNEGFSVDGNSTVVFDIQDCVGSPSYHPITPAPASDTWRTMHGN